MRSKRNVRAFFHTLIVMLSLTVLITGGICSEYNIRRTLGQPTDLFDYTQIQQDLSVWGERICWLFEPTGRALVLLFEWECELLASVVP